MQSGVTGARAGSHYARAVASRPVQESHMQRVAVLEAPSILALRPTGVETLPDALLRAGLLERLPARHRGRVVPDAAYDPHRDPTTRTLNGDGIAAFSRRLADLVGDILDAGEFPLVLGGDCS